MLGLVYFILYLFAFLVGSCIGSFLNVVVWRLPNGMSVAKGRSICPKCGHTIRPWDLIPLVSWLFLRGKCRDCGAPISPRYPIIEGLCGLAAVGLTFLYGFTLQAVCAFLLFAVLLPIALIDRETMLIPNGLVLWLILPAVACFFAFPEVGWLDRLIGFLAASLPLFLLSLLLPGSFGGGDVKLMAMAGLVLGWQNILLALFFGIVGCGLWTLGRLLLKKVEKGQQIPFGPWLCSGCMLAFVFGQPLLGWYLSLFI